MVDDPAGHRFGHASQRRELARSQVHASVGRDQQDPVFKRQAPWPASAYRVCTGTADDRDQPVEVARAQPGERGYPGRLRSRDHTRHGLIVSLIVNVPGSPSLPPFMAPCQ